MIDFSNVIPLHKTQQERTQRAARNDGGRLDVKIVDMFSRFHGFNGVSVMGDYRDGALRLKITRNRKSTVVAFNDRALMNVRRKYPGGQVGQVMTRGYILSSEAGVVGQLLKELGVNVGPDHVEIKSTRAA